jgi:hypothetical protein
VTQAVVTASITVGGSIFSDIKPLAFTHVLSGSINQLLETSMRVGYKRLC